MVIKKRDFPLRGVQIYLKKGAYKMGPLNNVNDCKRAVSQIRFSTPNSARSQGLSRGKRHLPY